MIKSSFKNFVLMSSLALGQSFVFAAQEEPVILDVIPPSDAGRGLVRTGAKEIRHYSGGTNQGGTVPYIISSDNGETWTKAVAGKQFPKKWGGIHKEAAATVYLPKSKKYMLIQPIRGYIFMSDDIDEGWYSPSSDGKRFVKADEWMKNQKALYPVPDGWIYRNPLELESGRIIIPMHKSNLGTRFLISDDKGLSWRISRDMISVPAFREAGIDQGGRWRNAGVEATAVELKNGMVYALVRTDSNMSYESFSKDGGNTWSKPKPSPFYGSLIMSTLGRLSDGKLICLWTNAAPMPELAHTRGTNGEDVFTGRGGLHVAFSKNEGKSWYGYREVIIDARRNAGNFATLKGGHDRSNHQSEFLELDDKRILVTSGQHPAHCKMIIINQDWVDGDSRSENFEENGLMNIHGFSFIPKAHRIQYNRKSGVALVDAPDGRKAAAAKYGILNDDSLINAALGADYRRSGISWNFPLAHAGSVSFNLYFPKGSSGTYVSLTDRMFNPCDPSTPERAVFSCKLAPGQTLGGITLKEETPYHVKLNFIDGVAKLYLNRSKKAVGTMRAKNSPKIGLSYLHLLAAEDATVTKSKDKAEPVAKSKFFQFKAADGTMEEKSCIVSDFEMKKRCKN